MNFQYNLGTFNLYSQKNNYDQDFNFGIKEDIKIKSKLSGCQINLGYAFISNPIFNIITTAGVGLHIYKSQIQFLDIRDSLRSKDYINQTSPNPNFMQRMQETGNTKSMTYNLGLQSEINLTPVTCQILGAQYSRTKNDDIDLLNNALSINHNWDSYLQLHIGLALKVGGDVGGGCCTLCQIGCMPWGCRRLQNTLYLKKTDRIKTAKTTFSM